MPGIVAGTWAGVLGEGNSESKPQLNWCSPADVRSMNHHGLRLKGSIDADELVFKPTAPPRENVGQEP